jgi:hypothetical protein
MGQALFVLIVAVIVGLAIAVPIGLTVAVFVTSRALVSGERRALAGLGLGVALVVVAYGLAAFFGGANAFSDTSCIFEYRGSRNLEGATIVQSSGFWPPGLRCRYEFGDGEVTTYSDGFEIVWVATAMTAVFGAAMGVVVVGRQFSKKGDMLF